MRYTKFSQDGYGRKICINPSFFLAFDKKAGGAGNFFNLCTMKNLCLALVALACSLTSIKASTSIPAGTVSGEWTKAGSPYYVEGSVMIADGQTLAIQPGVTVYFASFSKLYVQGQLLATGIPGDSIVFTTEPGFLWKGIRFENTPSTNDSSILEYCVITRSVASGMAPDTHGGGICFDHFSKAAIMHCRIAGCMAGEEGGAIYCNNSSPEIIFNTITGNTAGTFGCGISLNDGSNPEIAHNLISYNTGGSKGGGIYCNLSNPVIRDNTISYNSLSASNSEGGGGIYCTQNSPLIVIEGNFISDNRSNGTGSGGGGICFFKCDAGTINNNVIVNNECESTVLGGGGICFIQSRADVINCTIVGNHASTGSGGGLFFTGSSSPEIVNCILFGNTAQKGWEVGISDEGSDPDFLFCDVQGGKGIFDMNGNFYLGNYQNNLDVYPEFLVPPNQYYPNIGKWSLKPWSNCINNGNPAGSYPPEDFLHHPRVFDSRIDMGACESQAIQGIMLTASVDTIFAAAHAEGSRNIIIHANVPWLVSSGNLWLTFRDTMGMVNGFTDVYIADNPDSAMREGLVTISGEGAENINIPVIQEAPYCDFNTDTIYISHEANASAPFHIGSNTSWALETGADWFYPDHGNGYGSQDLEIFVNENPGAGARTAVLTAWPAGLHARRVVIRQAGFRVLTVSVNSLSFKTRGETKPVSVLSNIPWTAGCSASWVSVDPSAATGDAVLKITAAANSWARIRTASVTLSGEEVAGQVIRISQEAASATLDAAPVQVSIARDSGSTATFRVLTNATWTARSSQAWLHLGQKSGMDTLEVTVTADENRATIVRRAIITLYASGIIKYVVVTQQEALPSGTGDITATEELRLYPNPTRGEVTLDSNQPFLKESKVEIYSTTGVLLKTVELPEHARAETISLAGFKPGPYILVINQSGIISKLEVVLTE